MIKTREVGERLKGILLEREQENLGRIVERIYLGEESKRKIGTVGSKKEKEIKKSELENRECIKTFTGHKDFVLSVVFSPNG